MSSVLGVGAHGDIDRKFLVDVAENASPVNLVIGKNAIEHILTAVKQRLQGDSAVIRGILDGKEREEDHQLDHLAQVDLQLRLFSKAIFMSCELFIIFGKGQYCRIICNVDIRVPIRVGRNIIDVSPLVLIKGEVHLCLHIQNGSISIFCHL